MYDLDRFIKAQNRDYETALEEIKAGYKRSHWMWYIFPQIIGLGRSEIGIDRAKRGMLLVRRTRRWFFPQIRSYKRKL